MWKHNQTILILLKLLLIILLTIWIVFSNIVQILLMFILIATSVLYISHASLKRLLQNNAFITFISAIYLIHLRTEPIYEIPAWL